MCQIGIAIAKHDWNAMVSPRVKEHVGTPFVVCLNGCLRSALKWLPSDLGPEERVGVVFDQGTPAHTRQVAWGYGLEKGIRENVYVDHRLGPLQFEDKRCCPPLQAADIPALLHYQFVRDRDHAAGRVRKVYAELYRRLGKANTRMGSMTDESLRAYVKDTEATLKRHGL